mmetsp:Transcript_88772/g.251595  ORF Transcript_88772/g.251595 Transcript_88772/m.251595 type:complete len:127 (+) Transcript_88772:289-669(+)
MSLPGPAFSVLRQGADHLEDLDPRENSLPMMPLLVLAVVVTLALDASESCDKRRPRRSARAGEDVCAGAAGEWCLDLPWCRPVSLVPARAWRGGTGGTGGASAGGEVDLGVCPEACDPIECVRLTA